MSNSFEKSVKGGTKVKLAPPKTKYVEHILLATQSEAGVAEVFRTLTHRLRDSTWTVAFKSLILVHLMVKEGAPENTLRYLAVAPRNRLAVNSFTDVQTQGHNIRLYSEYLLARALAYEKTRFDFLHGGEEHMRRITVNKGLLRETEVVQSQIRALIKCDFFSNEQDNEISLTAFRLLTSDLLELYTVQNEAVMNVLSHYFEMSKPDAERAIKIYKAFCAQTDQVVQFLSIARRYEYATRLEIPKLKHAPTSLAVSLQEYVDDQDFEINRRQYLAEQEARKGGKPFTKSTSSKSQPTSSKTSAPTVSKGAPQLPTVQPTKAPGADLIDFFESLDLNQPATETNPFLQQAPQQMQQQQIPQATGYVAHQQNMGFQQPMNGFPTGPAPGPFPQTQHQPPPPQPPLPPQQTLPLQTQFTGAGFGGYSPQPPQQQPFATNTSYIPSPTSYVTQSPNQIQPQSTNPFRQSMMPTGGASAFHSPVSQQSQSPQQPQHTNPFARPPPIPENTISPSPFAPQQQAQPLQAQATGTNPFARPPTAGAQPPIPSPLSVQATGSTNPFRQSAFVNAQTGQGWQNSSQPATMGGFETLDTIPVFPRPGGQPQVQQHQQQQHQQQQTGGFPAQSSPWI